MLACSDEGRGAPIVFVHGMGTDRSRWAPIVELLAGEFRCIAVDLPGHGESPTEGCDALSAASAIHDLATELDLMAPTIVGHSLGSTVALLYGALFAPASVVAVDPAPLFLPHLCDSLAPYRERMLSGDFDAAFGEWELRFRPDLVPEPLRSTLSTSIRPRAEVTLSYWRALLDAVVDPEKARVAGGRLTRALASIAVPTLICLANPPTPEDAAILGQIPTVTVEIYEGMGHWLHLVDPTRFAERLQSWIAGSPG